MGGFRCCRGWLASLGAGIGGLVRGELYSGK